MATLTGLIAESVLSEISEAAHKTGLAVSAGGVGVDVVEQQAGEVPPADGHEDVLRGVVAVAVDVGLDAGRGLGEGLSVGIDGPMSIACDDSSLPMLGSCNGQISWGPDQKKRRSRRHVNE